MSSRVVGAVLAAGAGTRMGGPKAQLRPGGISGGERLIDRAVRLLGQAGCAQVIAVVRPGLTLEAAPPTVRAIVNDDPGRGLRSSLALAVQAAGAADALAVTLVDLPGLTAGDVRAVLAGWRPGRIAVAVHAGRRGHPTVMPPDLWQAALGLAGADEGARRLLQARADLVDEIEVDGDPADLDTPADLARWRRGRR